MARRPSTSAAPVTPTTSPEVTNEKESTVTDTVTEAVPETPAEAVVEVPIDLTEFIAAVDTAIPQADEATGQLPLAAVDPVNVVYRGLEGIKAKNAAKRYLSEHMRDEMTKSNFTIARTYLQLQDSLTVSGGPKDGKTRTEKVPADPTEAFVQKAATLRLAINLVADAVPEGVGADWADKAKALVESSTESATGYIAWLLDESEDKGDEPETSNVVKAAVKLSLGKSAKVGSTAKAASTGSTYVGERRDIAKHIAEAFEGVDSGTFMTIADIRKFVSAEYGTNLPSAGAISARLFPSSGKCTLDGVVPSQNEKGNKGATKV